MGWISSTGLIKGRRDGLQTITRFSYYDRNEEEEIDFLISEGIGADRHALPRNILQPQAPEAIIEEFPIVLIDRSSLLRTSVRTDNNPGHQRISWAFEKPRLQNPLSPSDRGHHHCRNGVMDSMRLPASTTWKLCPSVRWILMKKYSATRPGKTTSTGLQSIC